MNRFLVSFSAVASLAAAAAAQCGSLTTPGTLIGAGDDTIFAATIPLGFTFTMNGSAGTTTWTHFKVCTNGWIALCDATGTLANCPTSTSYGSVGAASATSLYGPASSNPRIAPYWGDLYANVAVSASAGVYYDNTTAAGTSCTVTWKNVYDYTTTVSSQILKTFQVKINASGTIDFSYASGMNYVIGGSKYVGLSASNATAVPAASNFAPGPAGPSAGPAMHELFSVIGSLDLGGRTISFVPSGTTWSESVTCAVLAASNTNYGQGCYNVSAENVYQTFADAAAASAALPGNVMNLAISGNSYVASWLPGVAGAFYLAPSLGATSLATTDDGDTTITPSSPLTVPGGSSAQLTISHNGIITLGAIGNNSFDFSPSGIELSVAAGGAFYSWHDWYDSDTGSGVIKTEEVGGVLYITWDNVESYPSGLGQGGTQQFQLNLATGAVNIVWTAISPDITSSFGSAYVVGYKGVGVTPDAGSVNLATALPGSFRHLTVMTPMTLSATPAPVSTGATGTLVTYTQSNIPEAAPASGVYLGITIISVSQNLAGADLGIIGMPGCNLYVNSLDITNAFVGPTNSLTTQFQVPAAVPYGFQFFAQAAALVVPNSLPNGQNAFGATVSNGVASFVSFF